MQDVLDRLTWPVTTERLVLRPATAADTEAVWRYRRLDEVARWITAAPPDLAAFRLLFATPDRLSKTLVYTLDDVVIGDLMLAVQDAWTQAEVGDQGKGVQAELGWTLDPAYAGHGYATEAAQALLTIFFDRLGLRRVTADCFADNVASWRLMERIGMRRELAALRDSLHRDGQWLDGYGYALLAEEWRAATGSAPGALA